MITKEIFKQLKKFIENNLTFGNGHPIFNLDDNELYLEDTLVGNVKYEKGIKKVNEIEKNYIFKQDECIYLKEIGFDGKNEFVDIVYSKRLQTIYYNLEDTVNLFLFRMTQEQIYDLYVNDEALENFISKQIEEFQNNLKDIKNQNFEYMNPTDKMYAEYSKEEQINFFENEFTNEKVMEYLNKIFLDFKKDFDKIYILLNKLKNKKKYNLT